MKRVPLVGPFLLAQASWKAIFTTALLVVLVTHAEPVLAISIAERNALTEIFRAYPDLTSVPSWQQLTSDGQYYGRSWPKNGDLSTVCSRDGYDIYGIYCKGGSIVGLRMTEAFGIASFSSFRSISGLANLRNLTLATPGISTPYSDYWSGLIKDILAQKFPLIHLELPESARVSGFEFPSSLVYLSTGYNDGISLSTMPNLRYLKFVVNAFDSVAGLNLTHTSLEELHVSGPVLYQTFFSLSRGYPALHTLECKCLAESTVSAEFNSDQVKSLKLSDYYYNNGMPPIISGRNLEVLEAYMFNVTIGDLPSLKYLGCAAFSSTPGNVPNQLQTLALRGTDWRTVSLEAIVCPLIRSSLSSLESLTISPYGSSIEVIPSCITEPNLKYLQLDSLLLSTETMSSFLVNLPLSLRGLTLTGTTTISFKDLYRLRDLENLDLTSYSTYEELPSDLLKAFSALRTFKLYSYSGGSLPPIGGPLLEVVQIETFCESWDTVEASPNLKTLRIKCNQLRQIPPDDVFIRANLASLEVLELDARYARGPVPIFWANSAMIASVSITGNYSGPLPDQLTVPRLQNLKFAVPLICGGLPNFLVPTHLENLILPSNLINGTIPASWEENLSILKVLSLQNTFISGTIPQQLFTHHTLQLDQVRLSNTFVEGNIWDPILGPSTLDLSNTLISLDCPPFPTKSPSNIRVANISSCPQDLECLGEWKKNRNFNCYNQTDRVLPPIANCALAPRCPEPAPTYTFMCARGNWALEISTIFQKLSFGPNLGVATLEQFAGALNVTFKGSGTSLWAPQCISSLQRVFLEIDQDSNPDAGSGTLVRQADHCTSVDLRDTVFEVVSAKRTCFSTQGSTATTLSYTYEYCPDNTSGTSSSRSNELRWLIGSIFGLLLLIA